MRRLLSIALSSLFVTACAAAEVPQTVDKHYPLSGRAELHAEIGNGSIRTRSCGGCKDVHVHLEMNDADRSRFHLEEQQSGNRITFALKQDPTSSWNWHGGKSPELTIEVPAEAAVDLHSGNGSVALTGVHGDINLATGNGSVSIDGSGGQVRLHTGNGSVSGNDLSGSLNASTGNGSVHLAGRFSRIEAHTGNGSMELEAQGNDSLRDGATVTSGSGTVTMRIARDLHASLHLSTGSGGIHSDLPVTAQGDLGGDRHALDGTLNGGGATIRIRTGSGGVRLESL